MHQLSSTRFHELLADQLARDIVAGRLTAPGALPSEHDLALTYDVSKSVVRAAIQQLATAGLVRTRHGIGTTVTPPYDWDVLNERVQTAMRQEGAADDLIRDLYELRVVIEPQAAAWCALRASNSAMRRLKELVGEMETVAGSDDPIAPFLEKDRAFHATLAEASRNLVLCAVMRSLHNVVTTSWIRSAIDPCDFPTLIAQHTEILDAISARAPLEASQAMARHLQWALARELAGFVSSPRRPLPSRPTASAAVIVCMEDASGTAIGESGGRAARAGR